MIDRRLLFAALLPWVISCTAQESDVAQTATAEDLPECPHDSKTLRMENPPAAFLGEIADIPEYNDCQRFIARDLDGNLRYDSLFAIYRPPFGVLERLEDSLKSLRDFAGRPIALTVAVIRAEGDYQPLSIRRQYNCLLLYQDDSDWNAEMLWVGRDGQLCLDPIDPDTVFGVGLTVRRDVVADFPASSYPAVARWDWDRANEQHYMGVRCGGAWCEVGASGFVSSELQIHDPSWPHKLHRVRRVKGWYDEQILAEVDVDGRVVPSSVQGVVFPHPLLGEREASEYRGRWLPVAFASLSDESKKYQDRFEYDKTARHDPFNKISLCSGTKESCRVNDPGLECNGGWWAKIEDLVGNERFKCVVRRGMEDRINFPIPGTVRWRWLADDEGGWMRCGQGCCELT